MRVNFYATLRKISGQKTVEFDFNEGTTTAHDILMATLDRFPGMREELIDEDGGLFGHVHLFVNGRDSRFLEKKLDTILKSNDKVDIFPAVGGG